MTLPRLYAFMRYWKPEEKKDEVKPGSKEHAQKVADFIATMPVKPMMRPA